MPTKDYIVYTIYLINQGYYLDFKTDSLGVAVSKVLSCGYDAAICDGKSIVKTYSIIGGWS